MRKRCTKGKAYGSTCIDRSKECLKDAGGPVSESLRSVRNAVQARSAKYKIAKSVSPSALVGAGMNVYEADNLRSTQLHARRVLNKLRDEGDTVIKTNGLAKEKDVNWRAILGSGVNAVGSGDFGSFAALAEAMGAFSNGGLSGDYQARRWKGTGGDYLRRAIAANARPDTPTLNEVPVLKKVWGNRAMVLAEMARDGLSASSIRDIVSHGIGAAPSSFTRGVWDTISDSQAQKYIKMLYDGV